MKLLRTEGDHYQFRFGRREQRLFCELLRRYPVTPVEHHRIHRESTAPGDQQQALLAESMMAARRELQQRLDALLANASRFVSEGSGFRATFTRDELEWLLQVLNDLRVGSWLQLGCPDPEENKPPKLTPETVRYLPLMELAGSFEYAILAALDGTDGIGWAPRE